jgi:ribosomal protein S18 acetylase RimI-like enzyme
VISPTPGPSSASTTKLSTWRYAKISYFRDGCGLWLARHSTGQANVVGCIALRRLDAYAASGEVKRLYVRPEARGQGVAGLLLNDLHVYAQAEGYEWLYLDSKDDLAAAIRFYEKHGYRHCARNNDNPQATIFMNYRCDPV